MKTKIKNQNCLMEGGRKSWVNSSEFGSRVDQIKKELKEKYAPVLDSEKNWIRRIVLRVKLQLEIREKIGKLGSIRNLHIANP